MGHDLRAINWFLKMPVQVHTFEVGQRSDYYLNRSVQGRGLHHNIRLSSLYKPLLEETANLVVMSHFTN